MKQEFEFKNFYLTVIKYSNINHFISQTISVPIGGVSQLRSAPQLSPSDLLKHDGVARWRVDSLAAFGGARLVFIVVSVDVDAQRLVVLDRLFSYLHRIHEHVDLRFGRQHPSDDVVHLGVALEFLGSAFVPADDLVVGQVSKRPVALTATVVLTFVAELTEVVRYERGAAEGLLE